MIFFSQLNQQIIRTLNLTLNHLSHLKLIVFMIRNLNKIKLTLILMMLIIISIPKIISMSQIININQIIYNLIIIVNNSSL